MTKKRFICERCEESFVIEVLEPGEAERKRIREAPIRCPRCGGPVRED
jgi:DNA-directed RNA polymerase subunit RPC12/RpoP